MNKFLSPEGRRLINIVRKKLKRNPDLNLSSGTFGVNRDFNNIYTPQSRCCPIGVLLIGKEAVDNDIEKTFIKHYKLSLEYINGFWNGFDGNGNIYIPRTPDQIKGFNDGTLFRKRLLKY